MQISEFTYSGEVLGIIIGASAAMYAGAGGGFERGKGDIQRQYRGTFEGREGGGTIPLPQVVTRAIGKGFGGFGVSVGNFNSPSGQDPWIYATYLALSAAYLYQTKIFPAAY